jgi:hypothetical protein
MSEQLTQLRRLADELHEINQELSRAARPLEGRPELDDRQKQDIGARLRAGLARWEDVTRQISRALQTDGATGPGRDRDGEV